MAENIFELLKIDFKLDLFLEREGFEFFPKDSKKVSSSSRSNLDGYEYKVYKYLQGSSTLSTLLVSKTSNGHYVYNNPNDSSDKGTIIDYLMRYKGMDWRGIAKFAKDSNIQLPDTTHQAKPKRSPKVDKSTPPEVIDVQHYRSNPYYKNDRQIEDVIEANPYIKDSIKFVKFSRKNHEGKKQVLFGHAFSIRNHKGETTTFNMKSDFFKRGMFLGERQSGVWYALPEQKPKSFIIGEAGIDVISYYKHLNTNQPLGLISTEGRFSTRYADEVMKLVPNINQSEVVLVNDNDVHGFHYDLAWMKSLRNLPYSVGIKKLSPNEKFIRIESVDQELAEELSQFKQEEHLIKPDQVVQVIKHIKNKFGINNILIHKSPLNDWNKKIVADAKKKD